MSSFLFHATHTEQWRKKDAGMTSGVMVFPIVWAICDRIMPVSLGGNYMVMILCGEYLAC